MTKANQKSENSEACLPSFWKFYWMFFMQPISLHSFLKKTKIDTKASTWELLKKKKNKNIQIYFIYQVTLLLLIMPIFSFVISMLLQYLGLDVNWLRVVFGTSLGAVGGIFVAIINKIERGVAYGVTFGIFFGVFFGIVNAVANIAVAGVLESNGGVLSFTVFSIFHGTFFWMILTAAAGLGIGFSYGIANGISNGFTLEPRAGVSSGFLFGVIVGSALWVISRLSFFTSITDGTGIALFYHGFEFILFIILMTVVFLIAFLLSYLRILFYLLEVILQFSYYIIKKPPYTLLHSPIFYHEISYFPYPFLGRMIEESAVNHPFISLDALAQCIDIPGQRQVSKRAFVRLRFKKIHHYFQKQEFESIYHLKGQWLPGHSQDNPETLRKISEIGRYLYSYQNAIQAQQQLQHLQKALDQLQGLQNHFLAKKSDWSSTASAPLKTWQQWIKAEIQKIEQQTTKEIPNPFYYGRPISPEYGTNLFRGRETIAQHIEQLLADHQQSLSIALLAPRRCGKSSMLKMLPTMLPDAIFVFYDLQDNTVDSIEGFFRSLVKRTQEQAYQDRGIKIPDLPEGTAFESGREWLELVDKQVNQTLLICIDEFERLPELLPESRQKLLQLMSLFRATIQHRQHIRLLVSGTAPFDELEYIWNDNFINVQEIKLPHLDYQSSIGLIREPIKAFPKDAIPADLADAIYQRSNGQPFLLQAFAGLTIDHLNNNELKTANLDMLDDIEENVMKCCSNYFRDVYGSAPESAKLALRQLSNGENCVLDRVGKRWLLRRLLITEQEGLVIPIFGHWVREFAGDL